MYSAKNVRPRSSLSTDDNHRIKDTNRPHKAPSNTILTLSAFCVFLLVLCGFLLGALVYVGKNIADEHQRQQQQQQLSANSSQLASDGAIRTVYVARDQLLSTKPILSVLAGWCFA